MAQGEITKEIVLSAFIYRDGALFWKKPKGNNREAGDRAGRVSKDGYRRVYVSGKGHLEHRLVFLMFNDYLPDYIDHINHNRSDNNIDNLRECTRSENNFNSVKSKNNTSGYKGVYWEARRSKWLARIEFNGKQKFIGRYEDIEEAANAVSSARIDLHGKFACNG